MVTGTAAVLSQQEHRRGRSNGHENLLGIDPRLGPDERTQVPASPRTAVPQGDRCQLIGVEEVIDAQRRGRGALREVIPHRRVDQAHHVPRLKRGHADRSPRELPTSVKIAKLVLRWRLMQT